MWNINKILFFLFFCTIFLCCTKTEYPSEQIEIANRDLDEILASDTLHVATMRGVTSYFLYRNETMGYNYELISDFAKYLNVTLDIRLADTEQELTDLLSAGEVDIIAYNLYETKERKADFYFVFPRFSSHQVLIQRLGRSSLSDVIHLAGKDVHVKENSIYHRRLKDLNKEIGGTINIVFVPDSLTNDDLIWLTLENEIEFTIAYQNDARVHRVYYPQLDYQIPVGFTQHSGWLIDKNTPDLLAAFETWAELATTQRLQQRLESRYRVRNPYLAARRIPIPAGAISPYDDLFRKFAPIIDWDWQLLAAIAFHESTFDSSAVSHVGASGLMQLMPRTGEIFGLDSVSIFNPEENIRAAVYYIRDLNRLFRQVENKNERIKFVLAAYNAGRSHVFDAMALAEIYGKNPHIWDDNVEYFLEQKGNPEFHQDPVVQHGSFNASETVRFVDNVLDTYERYMRKR
jgi:membrane-bound lytic murein transglycosylase F